MIKKQIIPNVVTFLAILRDPKVLLRRITSFGTVIKDKVSDVLSLNHCNHRLNLLKRNHRNQFTKKTMGQSIAEYSILIAVVTAALLAMQLYMKRGIQAAVKHSTDQFGTQDYMETDPDKVMQQEISQHTASDATMRIQQEGVGDSAKATYTFFENSTNTGTSVYWIEQEEL